MPGFAEGRLNVGDGATDATALVEAEEERIALEKAKVENTIVGYVEFLRQNPRTALVDEAVQEISRILSEEFPSSRYAWSVPKTNLARFLLPAIRERKPLVVAFAPHTVPHAEDCFWTTHFREIAGVGVRLDRVVPSYITPNEGTWRGRDGNLKEPIAIGPYGRAKHTWSCWNGPWMGSEVVLSYFGSYGPQRRFVNVKSRTRFPG